MNGFIKIHVCERFIELWELVAAEENSEKQLKHLELFWEQWCLDNNEQLECAFEKLQGLVAIQREWEQKQTDNETDN